LISILVGLTLSVGFFFGKISVFCQVCPPENLDFSLFWQAYDKIKQDYVDPKKIDGQKVVYGAISGMLKSLNDPYTVFFSPEESKTFLEDIAGRFEGVGMEIGVRDKNLQIIAPLEGTPAQKAGLLPGDRILMVDSKPTAELSLEEVVSLIRGARGTKVVLTILRQGWEKARDFQIERAVIKVPSLKWEMKGDKIAYIRLYQFSQRATLDFMRASIGILSGNGDRIILDLRNNPGGYLEVSQDIASFFLEPGQTVAVEDFGSRKNEYKSQGNPVFLKYPVVVLINQGSASASEILAAALRDNRGILLIGEQSFGKGSVQQLENLQGGSSLKITVAKWLTPNGETINEKGLKPDILVKMDEKDYQQGRDPQLDKAVEVIGGL
jgi:carboxyl-terminal processing protease